MDKLSELAARCEAATGPDLALDAEIGQAVEAEHYAQHTLTPVTLCYTASLDAAMTLVEEPEKGVSVWYTPRDGGLCCATVHHGEVTEARTMSLALCAAALRARATLSSNASDPK